MRTLVSLRQRLADLGRHDGDKQLSAEVSLPKCHRNGGYLFLVRPSSVLLSPALLPEFPLNSLACG